MADPFAFGPSIDKGHAGANLEMLVQVSRAPSRFTTAFVKGAAGEAKVGQLLDTLKESHVLHSRRFGHGDIDHIVITSSGIWVVDTKNYSGEISMPLLGSLEDLRFRGRKLTKQLDSIGRQLAAVADATPDGAPAFGVVCITGASWPTRRLARHGSVLVTEPRRLLEYIRNRRPAIGSLQERYDIAVALDAAFPAA